jgi:hypothetical protein
MFDVSAGDVASAPRLSPLCRLAALRLATRPEWVQNDDSRAALCMETGANFGMLQGRHHCRTCGGIFVRDVRPSVRPFNRACVPIVS